MSPADKYLRSYNFKIVKEDDDFIIYENKKEHEYLEIYKKTGLFRVYIQEEIPFYDNTERKVVGVAFEELKCITLKLKELGFKIYERK